jgi:hypothetical protein
MSFISLAAGCYETCVPLYFLLFFGVQSDDKCFRHGYGHFDEAPLGQHATGIMGQPIMVHPRDILLVEGE